LALASARDELDNGVTYNTAAKLYTPIQIVRVRDMGWVFCW